MPLKYKQLKKIISDYGFVLAHQKGSHQKFVKKNKLLLVPRHKEFRPGTALSVIKTMSDILGIEQQDIIEKYKIKF